MLGFMRPLLCLSGKRFTGKDTFAALLREQARRRGADLALFAFAGESKRLFAATQEARGEPVDLVRLLVDRAYKEAHRPHLTRFTVDAIAADPLVFCREVVRRIEATPGPSLITDLRLRLEVDHLRRHFDPRIIRLIRPDALRAGSGWAYRPEVDDHPTETELDDPGLWTESIHNDGSLADLAAQAESLIARYLESPG
jgi:phosphomevalonate kinase